jgi:hypothetical protein
LNIVVSSLRACLCVNDGLDGHSALGYYAEIAFQEAVDRSRRQPYDSSMPKTARDGDALTVAAILLIAIVLDVATVIASLIW